MKKLVIFIVLPLLLIVGAGAGLYFAGIFGHEEELGPDGQKKIGPAATGIFFDVPDFIINLKGKSNKVVFLQLKLNLELKKIEDVDRCKQNLPRIQDAILTYFHRMEPERIEADPGFVEIRAQLVQRVRNSAKPPIDILNVNISDLRIQ
jgi:flagellar FliL protein